MSERSEEQLINPYNLPNDIIEQFGRLQDTIADSSSDVQKANRVYIQALTDAFHDIAEGIEEILYKLDVYV